MALNEDEKVELLQHAVFSYFEKLNTISKWQTFFNNADIKTIKNSIENELKKRTANYALTLQSLEAKTIDINNLATDIDKTQLEIEGVAHDTRG